MPDNDTELTDTQVQQILDEIDAEAIAEAIALIEMFEKQDD